MDFLLHTKFVGESGSYSYSVLLRCVLIAALLWLHTNFGKTTAKPQPTTLNDQASPKRVQLPGIDLWPHAMWWISIPLVFNVKKKPHIKQSRSSEHLHLASLLGDLYLCPCGGFQESFTNAHACTQCTPSAHKNCHMALHQNPWSAFVSGGFAEQFPSPWLAFHSKSPHAHCTCLLYLTRCLESTQNLRKVATWNTWPQRGEPSDSAQTIVSRLYKIQVVPSSYTSNSFDSGVPDSE